VDFVFGKLMLICRGFDALYSDMRRLKAEKTQWSLAFSHKKIYEMSQIKHALNKLIDYKYPNPPQIGEFLSWCNPNPQDLGLPSVDEAFEQACKRASPYNKDFKFTHNVVYHAYSMMSSYDYVNLPRATTFPIFARNYEITVRMFVNNEPLKKIPIAITHDKELARQKKVVNSKFDKPGRSAAMLAMRSMLQ
jgi:hypothetical protein